VNGVEVALPDLCSAIASRHLLALRYKGKDRLVEPYCHGFAADGREMLVAFQREGESASGQEAGWKAMVIADLEHVELLDVPFVASRADYNPDYSKNLARVHCCV
jgi:hypothetical protein